MVSVPASGGRSNELLARTPRGRPARCPCSPAFLPFGDPGRPPRCHPRNLSVSSWDSGAGSSLAFVRIQGWLRYAKGPEVTVPPSRLARLEAAGLIPPRSSLQRSACLTMGTLSRGTWAQRLDAFRVSPSAFMEGPEGEDLGRDLLNDLRSEKLSEQTKVGPAHTPHPPWPVWSPQTIAL